MIFSNLIKELRIKNKVLAERVQKALASKEPTISFKYYNELNSTVKIESNIPSEFESKIHGIKMIKLREEYERLKQILDDLHNEFDPRIKKVTEAYVGVIESILAEAADQFNESTKSLAEGSDDEESD